MAITKHADGSIALRDGNGASYGTLCEHYGSRPDLLQERIGGTVLMMRWRFERDGVRYAAVATAGLDRVPFEGVPPCEVVCEVLEGQEGAAQEAVGIVVRRAVEQLESPWEFGRVWMNDRPFLSGTLIRGIVVSPEGPAGDQLRDADGNRVGDLHTVVLLTDEEARTMAMTTADALVPVLQQTPHLLADVERDRAVMRRQLPYPPMPMAGPGTGSRRHYSTLATTRVVAVKHLHQHAVRWLECNEEGTFAAFTQLEKAEELKDPGFYEVWTLENIVERNLWLRDFALTAIAGDTASYDDANQRWLIGRL